MIYLRLDLKKQIDKKYRKGSNNGYRSNREYRLKKYWVSKIDLKQN